MKVIYEVTGNERKRLNVRSTVIRFNFSLLLREHTVQKCTGAKVKPSVYLAQVGWNRNCILLLHVQFPFMVLSGKICRAT